MTWINLREIRFLRAIHSESVRSGIEIDWPFSQNRTDDLKFVCVKCRNKNTEHAPLEEKRCLVRLRRTRFGHAGSSSRALQHAARPKP